MGLSIWLHSLPMQSSLILGAVWGGGRLREVHSTVIYKVTLDLGPSLRFESLFHPHSCKYHTVPWNWVSVHKLCRILFSHKAWFTERNNEPASSKRQWWRCKWGKSKTRGESSLKMNLVEKTSLVPTPFFLVLCTIFIEIINYQSFFFFKFKKW